MLPRNNPDRISCLQEQDRLTATDARTVADALEQAAAPNTRRAYAGAWAAFTAWASGSGYPVLPASQETLAAYLGQLAGQGRKLATLRMHRAAVVKAHRLSGHPSPDGELVAMVIKGLGRQFGGPQKQSQPLTNTALAAVRATAPIPRRTRGGNMETSEEAARRRGGEAARRGAMDVAIITTMRDGLLRVSEAAALTWGDIQPQPDGSGLMRIRQSKTDALSEGVLLYLGEEAMQPGFGRRRRLAWATDSQATRRGLGWPLTLWVTGPSYRRLWWPADGSRQRWSAGTPRGQRRAVGRWPDTTGRPREGALNLKDDY